MPRLNRSEICGRDEVQAFHLINRCVRRTYLCGKDKRSGKDMIRNDVAGLVEKRKRLSDISWFMRCLVEPIARRSNREDEVSGRFWEGRFKAQSLLDETAIAACMAYVDLNPIRAGIASTPETSDFTSVKERIEDRQSAAEVSTPDAQDVRTEHGECAGWLAPLVALESPRKKVREKQTTRRASSLGCLPMSLNDYLTLIDWTGRQIRQDKTGRIPAECAPILQRLKCDAETWLDFVKNFHRRFRNAAGLPRSQQSFRTLLRTRRQSPLAT